MTEQELDKKKIRATDLNIEISESKKILNEKVTEFNGLMEEIANARQQNTDN